MAQGPVDEEEMAELADLYKMLKRDAKDILQDLLGGVSLWNSTAKKLFYFAATTFLVGLFFLWGTSQTAPPLSYVLALLTILLIAQAYVTVQTARRYRQRFLKLKEKYKELYETVKDSGE